MPEFNLHAPYEPTGDQPEAIDGLVAGLACGLFFGEYCQDLNVIGEVFIGLLQMTVLPYIVVALIANIGRLSFAQGKTLFLKESGVTKSVLLQEIQGHVLAEGELMGTYER